MLRKGGVVAIPTETAYGLAADSMNEKAIRKIYLIKGRSKTKPLPLIAASLKIVKKFFVLNKTEKKLAHEFWPGPLTILLKPRKKFPFILTRGKKRIAVRVSSLRAATEISEHLGRPITSTSANLSGRGECYSASAVAQEFKNKVTKPDMILSGGRLPRRKLSTIISVRGKDIKVLRQGQIKLKANG